MAVPRVTLEWVSTAVRELYGIEVTEMGKLPGYDDCNVWVVCRDGRKYVLKIKLQTFNHDVEALVASEIKHLHKAGFQVPNIIPTVNGKDVGQYEIDFSDGSVARFPVQLLAYIHGRTLYQCDCSPDELYIVAQNMGRLLGILQKQLLSIPCKQVRRGGAWCTECFPELRKELGYCPDDRLRSIVEYFIDCFEEKVLPKLPELRQGAVHGDFSNINIILIDRKLVTNRLLTEEELLTNLGILDFTDAQHGYVIFDVTVCIAYMMTQAIQSKADPIRTASQILRGYNDTFSLTEFETDVIFWGVAARLSTSYVMSFKYHDVGVDVDKSYYGVQASKCPPLLKMLYEAGKNETMAVIQNNNV